MEYVIDWKSDACRGSRPAPSRRHVCPLLPNGFPRVYASLHEPVSSTAASVSLLNEKSVEAQCPAMAHFTQRNSSGSYHGSPGPPRPAAAPVPGSTCCFPIFHFLSPPTKCKLHQYRDLCSLLNSKQPDWHIVDAQCLSHVDTVYVHSLCSAHRETGNHGYLWGGELGAGVGVGGNSSFTSLYSRHILSLQKVISAQR